MEIIEIKIPTEHLPIVIDALCGIDYPDKVQDEEGNLIDNPQTRGQFAKKVVIDYVKNRTKQWQQGILTSGAYAQANQDVEDMGLE